MNPGRCLLLCSLLLAGVGSATASQPSAEGLELFEKTIRPTLIARCYECHSSQAKELGGNLSLESAEAVRKGGDLGPAIAPGEPERSLLIEALRWTDSGLQMPPKTPLPKEVVADFEKWIKLGAPDPRKTTTPAPASKYVVDIAAARGQWPYLPISNPPTPEVRDRTWPRSAIDHFVLQKLEERGLTTVRDAERRTLIRRVTYDLIGLPPTPEEVQAFLDDPSPDAFATVVDRLLASPHYGERWGRHWLDVARYADTAGDNSDYPIPQMYRYRNWVIDAFNRDLRYNEFIRQQIAGDLLPTHGEPERQRGIIATGYIANARRFGSRVDDYPQHLTIEDTLDNLGRAFLGLSINCARCHDHKFDPITTKDYYALYGVFQSTRYPWPGIELDKRQRHFVPLGTPEEIETFVASKRQRVEALNAELAPLDKARDEAAKALKESEKQLADARNQQNADQVAALESALKSLKETHEAAKRAADAKRAEKDAAASASPPYGDAYAVVDGKPADAKVQLKGEPERQGDLVPRRMPEVFGGQPLPEAESGSGRKQLAEWIASPANPLTARVMVNRLWHHHFGKGLVATPNDFGRQGKPPTHPELLDHLASQFIASGWSVKAMHRQMVLSRTYQLASDDDPKARETDPTNQWLWRYPQRRLDAESIRDAMLLIAGTLDMTPATEPHPFPPMNKWDFTQHKPFKDVYPTNRRSIYLMTQRIQRHPFLAIFDGPDTGASTGHRITSTTTLQSLYLLNDEFVHQQASQFAKRLFESYPSDEARLTAAYEWCFARKPDAEEQSAGIAYLQDVNTKVAGAEHEAWSSLLRVLLRTNEFVYID